LSRMEDLGIVTRGLLVRDINALQYAEKETASALQQAVAQMKVAEDTEDQGALLCSADPANPFGIVADWPNSITGATYGRKPGNYMLFMNGRWEMWVEN